MQEKWLTKPNNEQDFRTLLLEKMWRLHNLYYIINEQGKKELFRPREAQLQFLLERHGFDLILKARQLGFSTAVQLDMLDDCLFNSDKNAGIIAQSMNDAEEIFSTKLKFPYDNLPAFIKEVVVPTRDSRTAIEFNNGSKIRVGVSMRSSTLTNLHISEHGKICAKDPERAKEIKTGSLNTVHVGQKITIESTAEGREGDFYSFCRKAEKLKDGGKKLSTLDFKFHFFPWFQNKNYVLDEAVVIPKEMVEYFDKLEAELGIILKQRQRNWYVKKEEVQGDEMKREFPSTSREAFEQAIEGTYFHKQFQVARKQGRIGNVPFDPQVVVNTFWDIGLDDFCAIWFHQRVGLENRFIGYYENSGEYFPHYANYLNNIECTYGCHFLPHDAENRNFRMRGAVVTDAYELLKGDIDLVPRITAKQDAVQAVRNVFLSCWFDEAQCALGIKRLETYRKQWNKLLGCWRSSEVDDDACHGTDAFMQFAQSYRPGDSKSGYAEEEDYDDWDEGNDLGQANR